MPYPLFLCLKSHFVRVILSCWGSLKRACEFWGSWRKSKSELCEDQTSKARLESRTKKQGAKAPQGSRKKLCYYPLHKMYDMYLCNITK